VTQSGRRGDDRDQEIISMNGLAVCRRAALILILLAAGCRSTDYVDQERVQSPSVEDTDAEHLFSVKLHNQIISVDSHAGFTSVPLERCGESERQVDFPKMRQGGVDAVFFIVYARQRERTPDRYAEAQASALAVFHKIHNLVRRCSKEVGLARTPSDVMRLVKNGKLAVVIGVENGFTIGKDLAYLKKFAERGAAYVGLTHDGHNDIADAAIPREELGDPVSEHGGVSTFGTIVIAELNRLGIMVDVSHLSRSSALDAIRLSAGPVIASHSSMYGIAPHPRNMHDQTALALAAKGGVIQITPVHEFIKVDPPGAMSAFYELLDEFDIESEAEVAMLSPDRRVDFAARLVDLEKHWARATVVHFVDHIDYAVGLVGVDHVGIGSDFDGGAGITGWMHAGETPNVTAELLRRGYGEEEIEKIWGGNLLRVWAENRQYAANHPKQ
jgi:membrane dipeptidase